MKEQSLESNKSSSLISDVKWYGGSLYLSKIITLPCSLITAKILGPNLYGTWNALRIILRYASLLQLGIFDGLTRELPLTKNITSNAKYEDYKESSFCVTVIAAQFGFIIVLILSFILKDNYPSLIIRGIRVISVIVFFAHIYGFYQYYLRADQKFALLSRARIIYSFFISILQMIGAYLFSINGLFISAILVNIGIVIFLFVSVPIKLRLPKLSVIKSLIHSGFPMLLNGMADTFLYTVDRIMIIAFLGRENLGYYAIALLASTFVEFIPSTIQSVLLPRIMRSFKTNNTQVMVEKFCFSPLYKLAFILPTIVGFGWIIAHLTILSILPKYLPSVPALKILSIGTCFAAVVSLQRNMFVALNKQYRVLGAFLLTTVFGYLLNYIFIKLGFGLTGVAYATSLAFLFLGILMLFMLFAMESKLNQFIITVLKIYSPIIIIGAFLLILDEFIPVSDSLKNEAFSTSLKLCIYIITTIPIFYLLKTQTGLTLNFFRDITKGHGE